MTDALIGYTGFVGSTIAKQKHFSATFNSKNIGDIRGRKFKTVFCAGAPGQKWLANNEPENDLRSIEALIANLDDVDCERFVLVSTVDVFCKPHKVDESSDVDETMLQPYGFNRRFLETFVERRFEDSTIVRLPALVGAGLKKNAIFDMAHDNQVERLLANAEFQFYPMHRLKVDIDIAVKNDLRLIHLTSEPTRLKDIAEKVFNIQLSRPANGSIAPQYDFRTVYGELYKKKSFYQVEQSEVFTALKAYAREVADRFSRKLS